MEPALPVADAATLRHIRRIQTITIVWMTVEAGVSLSAAWMAHSPALLAFGVPAAQAQGVGGEQPPAGVVSATPAKGTPQLNPSDNSRTQQIRQIVQCGNTMYAVGSLMVIQIGFAAAYRSTTLRALASQSSR